MRAKRSWANVSAPWKHKVLQDWLNAQGYCIVQIHGQWHVLESPPWTGTRQHFIVPAPGAAGFAHALALVAGIGFLDLPPPPKHTTAEKPLQLHLDVLAVAALDPT